MKYVLLVIFVLLVACTPMVVEATAPESGFATGMTPGGGPVPACPQSPPLFMEKPLVVSLFAIAMVTIFLLTGRRVYLVESTSRSRVAHAGFDISAYTAIEKVTYLPVRIMAWLEHTETYPVVMVWHVDAEPGDEPIYVRGLK